MDPSPGNMTPSWPVAIAHGIRNPRNPMIHQPYAAGPAGWMAAALVTNNTIATKIATMSKVVSTRGRMPPAMRSEISASCFSTVVMTWPPHPAGYAIDHAAQLYHHRVLTRLQGPPAPAASYRPGSGRGVADWLSPELHGRLRPAGSRAGRSW